MGGSAINLVGTPADLSPAGVVINLLLSAALAFIIAMHFRHFGSSFSDRGKFGRVLPAIALTTTLVISVVKASLALSLGLVGALSIVRFRTPVKEPEELAYLFMAIAVGLGMGADQRLVTILAILAILAILTIRALGAKDSKYPNLYLNMQMQHEPEREGQLRDILDELLKHVPAVDLRRFDVRDGELQATFFLDCKDAQTLLVMQEELTKRYPTASMTFVEQSGMPGV